ncbi:MAG: hydrogenase maturation protease [Pseudomonadota bacterium]
MGKVLVVGFGNLLLRDEGLGIHAVRALQERGLPPGVEAADGATSAMNILPFLEGVDLLIILDAILGPGDPGTLYIMFPSDTREDQEPALSLHELNIPGVLRLLESLGKIPPDRTVIMGLQPAVIEAGLDLSSEVAAALPRLIDGVLNEIGLHRRPD